MRTLERHGLDYCCGGKQPFDEACAAKGLKPESVMQEIERPQAPDASERDWQTAPLDEIVKHIVGTHHEYLKLELPALGQPHEQGARSSWPQRSAGPQPIGGRVGEIGHIDPEMLTRHLNGLPESSVAVPIYYVAGPPAMAKGLRAMLNDAGIDDDDIRTEEFGGY